jgi:hypothetical protein
MTLKEYFLYLDRNKYKNLVLGARFKGNPVEIKRYDILDEMLGIYVGDHVILFDINQDIAPSHEFITVITVGWYLMDLFFKDGDRIVQNNRFGNPC